MENENKLIREITIARKMCFLAEVPLEQNSLNSFICALISLVSLSFIRKGELLWEKYSDCI